MLKEAIKEIASVSDVGYPFVSLYLDLSTDPLGKTHYEQFLKKRIKEIETTISNNKEYANNFTELVKRIDSHLDTITDSETKGLAIFTSIKPDFFKGIELPVRFNNEMKLGYTPYLSQLVNISGFADNIATVVGDTRRAYIYISSLGMKLSEELIEGGVDFEQKTKQWSSKVYERSGMSFGYASDTTKKDRFEDKITQIFINDIITQLLKMKRDRDFNYLVITGVKEFINLLESDLNDELRDVLMDVSSLDIKQKSDHELIEFTKEIYNEFHEEQQRTHQKHLIEEILADGLAVAGIESTIIALTNGKVDTLIIGEELDRKGYSCINCTYFTASGKPDICPICNSEIVSGNLKEMMINLAERYNCDIQVVSEIDDFIKMGRVGAILRFK